MTTTTTTTTMYSTLRSIAGAVDRAASGESVTMVPLACVAWGLALATATSTGPFGHVLVAIGTLVALIPSLAAHLDRLVADDAGDAWDLDPSELPTVIVGPRPTVAPGRTVQPSWVAWGGAVVLG